MKINSRFFRLCFVVLLIGLGGLSGFAQNFDPKDYRLDAKASKYTSVTNLDLIRKVFPDAQINKDEPEEAAAAAQSIPLRHLFGEEIRKVPDIKLTLNISQRQETGTSSERILWLIINVVQRDKTPYYRTVWEAALMTAFRLDRDGAELIDAAYVDTQNITTFDEDTPKMRLAPHREAVVLSNIANATIGHIDLSIIVAGKNGFDVLINRFQMTIDYRCTDWFTEAASVRALKNSTTGLRNIEVIVKVKGGPGEAEFARVKYRRRFRYVFAWQGEKYAPIINPGRARRAFLKRIEPCREMNL